MFDNWQNYFGVLGAAAATLIGLLFIVATLMSGRPTPASARGAALFTSPVVFHLASVLANSALALAPGDEEIFKRLLMSGWALAGLIYAIGLAVRIARLESRSHWSDFWYYGVGPALAFLALCIAMGTCWLHTTHAAFLVGLSLLALLLVAIRNAWDLVTWLAPRREGGP